MIRIYSEKRPDVVIFPKNVIEVSTAVKICNEAKIPIIPFGTGTGLEGGINAIVVPFSFCYIFRETFFRFVEEIVYFYVFFPIFIFSAYHFVFFLISSSPIYSISPFLTFGLSVFSISFFFLMSNWRLIISTLRRE